MLPDHEEMTAPMDEREFTCPRCGTPLQQDAATGLMRCPAAGCGVIVRREYRDVDAADFREGLGDDTEPSTPDESLGDGAEWSPPPRTRGRKFLIGAVVVVTAVALVAMLVAPLLRMQRPVLAVSPLELSFVDMTGSGVMPAALTIENRGGGNLEWYAVTDAPWASLGPKSGSVDSELEILTVKIDSAMLEEGIHSATLTITGVGAQNSPLTVPIHVQVVTPSETRFIKELLGDNVDVHYGIDPPYVSGPLGEPIVLAQNEDAVDITWAELAEFLDSDPTDRATYVQDTYMCGAFARTLHDNAEAAGIRTAWVSLDIRGQEIGHALNAFLTSDRGLVFVDCTGGEVGALSSTGDGSPCGHDKIAYVKPGRECGLVSLDRADSPSYQFYTAYSDAWANYVEALDEYKRLEAEWSEFAGNRLLIPGSADSREAQRLHADLESRRTDLEVQKEVLGDCRWVSIGVVDAVHVYW